jgi:hypothetical protein
MNNFPAIPLIIKNKNLFLFFKPRKEKALIQMNNLILFLLFPETDSDTLKSKLISLLNGINQNRILNFNLQRLPVVKRDLSNVPIFK